MIRAVLDASVYVSAAVRPEGPPGQIVGRFLRGGSFEVVISQATVDEVLGALSYPKVRKYIRMGPRSNLLYRRFIMAGANQLSCVGAGYSASATTA